MSIFTNRRKKTELRQQYEKEVLEVSLAISQSYPDDERKHKFVIFAAQCLLRPDLEDFFTGPGWRKLVAGVEERAEMDATAKLVAELLDRAAGQSHALGSDVPEV